MAQLSTLDVRPRDTLSTFIIQMGFPASDSEYQAQYIWGITSEWITICSSINSRELLNLQQKVLKKVANLEHSLVNRVKKNWIVNLVYWNISVN
jgi:hypothetical protein